MFGGGIGELTHRWGTLETHPVLGYPVYFLTIIGIWKILGSLAILLPGFPRLKEWAYAGMFFNVSGAFVSLIYSGYYGAGGFRLIATGFILIFIIASWILRPLNRKIYLLKQ